jgi:hypothetical protein
MSAARQLLNNLAVIGATITPIGDRLILRAGPSAIPAALISRIRQSKAEIIAMLSVCKECSSGQVGEGREQAGNRPRYQTFEGAVIEWMNHYPAPSAVGRCAWCGRPESPSAVVLPFGTEPGTHTWLHGECWSAWHQARRGEAVAALRAVGIMQDINLRDSHGL